MWSSQGRRAGLRSRSCEVCCVGFCVVSVVSNVAPSSNLRFLSLQVERIPSSPSALVFQELEPGLAQLADEIAVAPGHGVGGVVEAEVVLGHVDGAVGANALDAPGGQLLAAGLQACLVQAPDAVVGDLEGSALVTWRREPLGALRGRGRGRPPRAPSLSAGTWGAGAARRRGSRWREAPPGTRQPEAGTSRGAG